MKKLLFLSVLTTILGFSLSKEKSEEQLKVERSVLAWADKTFEYYDAPRFENFTAVPTDSYFKLDNQVMGMKEYREEMKQSFADGEIKKSREEFEASLNKLTNRIDSLQTILSNHPEKVSSYEIDFWSNIKVSNGLTAYYKHQIKLDPYFAVTSSEIATSVGKVDDSIEIIYRK